jgi:hypothetical protein
VAQIIMPTPVLSTAVAKIAQRWLSFGTVPPAQDRKYGYAGDKEVIASVTSTVFIP